MTILKIKVLKINKKMARRYNASIQFSLIKIVYTLPKLNIFSVFSNKIDNKVYKKNLSNIEAIKLSENK